MTATLNYIGQIGTPYRQLEDCPRNVNPDGPICTLEIEPEFREGLLGLVPGQEILVLYWFENVDRNMLLQNPRNKDKYQGVFSLRSPHRPNPIGAAVVRIRAIENHQILVNGLDCLDGTPLLDIKPELSGNWESEGQS